MKTLDVLIILFFATSLFGCKYKNEAQELEKQNKSLAVQLVKSDSLSKVYLSTIKDVDVVIDSMMPEDNALETATVGLKLRARLTNKLAVINNLILDKESSYQSLGYKYAKSKTTVAEMQTTIEDLNREIKEKESANSDLSQNIKKLGKNIEGQSVKIESLATENSKLKETIEIKTKSINKAFYIIGDEKELEEKGIIEKTGGFLGFLGRVNTLNSQIDENRLQMIDIREKTTFTINSDIKNTDFVTSHNPNSYELKETNIETTILSITNPEEFWKNSKYLVVAY